MMIEPPIEKMSEKVGNKYKLAVLASKRALELQKQHIEQNIEPEEPELSQAANEIWEGKVVVDDSSIQNVKQQNNQ